MSVVLEAEGRSELPLIVFTTCVPISVGMCLLAPVGGGGFRVAASALFLATVGMCSSVARLAKPLRAPRSLANLKTSWLSREILAVGVFWALLVAWALLFLLGLSGVAQAAPALAGAVGVVLLAVIARAYRVSTRPAWCGPEGLVELWACAAAAGSTLSFAMSGCSCAPIAVVFAALTWCGLGLDVWSHHARRRRLEAMEGASDERVSLTLERYRKLWPRVRVIMLVQGLCCAVLTAVAVLFLIGLPVGSTFVADLPLAAGLRLALFAAAVGQVAAHGANRGVFYALPVQVRWVAPLRKGSLFQSADVGLEGSPHRLERRFRSLRGWRS